MGVFAVGEIVVIPFPYSDLSNSKLRPALILAQLENDDYILAQITSKNYNSEYIVAINNSDLKSGELKFTSFAKYSKIFTANKDIFKKSLGILKSAKVKEVISAIISLLDNQIK